MRRWIGPGILVAVGYMDPGNWAMGTEAGSGYGYSLTWVILLSSAAAILLQINAARIALHTRRDLIGLGYSFLGRKIGTFLAITAFIAVLATDLAEVLGFALALRLLLGMPLAAGAFLALAEVVFVLYWTTRRPRSLEMLVGILTLGIMGIFAYELFLLRPSPSEVMKGLMPSVRIMQDREMLYLTLGLIGATIMPHNLYLHSIWVQKERPSLSIPPEKALVRDTTVSLSLAFFVNVSLLLIAATLKGTPNPLQRWGIEEAYYLFEPTLGSGAMIAFGIALLLSGHNATLTTTLTGQYILEYLLPHGISSFWRSFILRSLALIPAFLGIAFWGEEHLSALFVLSQVILSLQLPFVLLPMLYFLRKLPEKRPSKMSYAITFLISLLITSLNFYLLTTL
ncbi:MAG: Nramp family divalent metal transporter [Bacteroidia bacterium]|nr:Nramp family divalent metal transporter [Bacteroidia bacterium]MDW8134281.1 Nramp family divalent metal transporter [Bacteroidia bacterium]